MPTLATRPDLSDIPDIAWGRAPEALDRAREPGVALAVWDRGAGPDVSSLARAIPPHDPYAEPWTTDRPLDADAARAGLAALGVGETQASSALAEDIAGLSALFARVAGTPRQTLRLERVSGPGCRLYHTDFVDLRMITTYRGRGTRALPESAVDRAGLGSGDNARICRDEAAAIELPTFAVGLFKGDAALGPRRGVVHRSPPAQRGKPRIVLVIDARR